MRMREVYGAYSSKIRRIPSPPRGRTTICREPPGEAYGLDILKIVVRESLFALISL